MAPQRAALFDMDGTLVRVNTGRLYLRWQRQRGELSFTEAARGLVWLLQYRLGVIEISQVTHKALRTLIGRDEARFRADCIEWFRDWVVPFITKAARDEVQKRRDAGDTVAIVTAGTDYAARPLAEELGIPHVLSTRLEVENGTFTGETQGHLCYGPQKVIAVQAWAKEAGVDLKDCSFYSDSITDLPLLGAVGEPVVVNPDPRLKRQASKNQWPVLSWR